MGVHYPYAFESMFKAIILCYPNENMFLAQKYWPVKNAENSWAATAASNSFNEISNWQCLLLILLLRVIQSFGLCLQYRAVVNISKSSTAERCVFCGFYAFIILLIHILLGSISKLKVNEITGASSRKIPVHHDSMQVGVDMAHEPGDWRQVVGRVWWWVVP